MFAEHVFCRENRHGSARKPTEVGGPSTSPMLPRFAQDDRGGWGASLTAIISPRANAKPSAPTPNSEEPTKKIGAAEETARKRSLERQPTLPPASLRAGAGRRYNVEALREWQPSRSEIAIHRTIRRCANGVVGWRSPSAMAKASTPEASIPKTQSSLRPFTARGHSAG
ncbi:hypothetical protein CfE428DRAFT_5522 [Chthoniobacter flavus Ellin428]|uniref:Uncharacterized protein n=1 Tax=Chthoniobacter flavus Ellin428 TaxID=497964 RepID=B4D9D2_9BACT|nr:hypothetical protein CfE428DRAFT_5522 [Chthoniobacter flavus Ellin428]